jgi:ElaB/YqjD/DUF883 family membrane-anchored ribosome-binding protein
MATFEHSANSNGNVAGNIDKAVREGDVQTLRDEVGHLTRQIAAFAAAAGEGAMDDMKTRMRRAKPKLDDLMSEAGEKGKDAADAVREATGPIFKGVEEAIREHPFATLALAAGLGLAFGAILRR